MSNKVYDIVTEKIVNALESNTVPWKKTWTTIVPQNFVSHKHYNGFNRLLLSMMGFEHPYFLTFNQARSLGKTVKKGAKGIPVIFWKFLSSKDSKDASAQDNMPERKIPLMRYYTVFNVADIEGLEIPSTKNATFVPSDKAENIVANMPNAPKFTFGKPAYVPSLDLIQMPSKADFHSSDDYYATLFHELTHSTGHASRLNRDEIVNCNFFGSEKYSREELVAEIGASFLCAECGISQTFDNNVAYIKGWLEKIKGDNKLLVTAANRAQKATDYILGNNTKPQKTTVESIQEIEQEVEEVEQTEELAKVT